MQGAEFRIEQRASTRGASQISSEETTMDIRPIRADEDHRAALAPIVLYRSSAPQSMKMANIPSL
jgi:hypothetical protein